MVTHWERLTLLSKWRSILLARTEIPPSFGPFLLGLTANVIVFVRRNSHSILRCSQVIILAELWEVKSLIRTHFEVFFVIFFSLVKLVYGIGIFLGLEISFFWKSQNHITINVKGFSSNKLKSFSLVISCTFKIVFHEIHWSSSVMIRGHRKGVWRIDKRVLHISWTQIPSVMRSVLL